MQTGRPRYSYSCRNVAAQWHALHHHYPRSASVLAVAIVLALLADLFIIFQQYRFKHEAAELGTAILRAEEQRSELAQQADLDLAQARTLLPRRDALVPVELHLSVDRRQGVMYLIRDRAILREMPVYLGPELAARPDDPAPPLKTRRVLRLVEPPRDSGVDPLQQVSNTPGPQSVPALSYALSGGLVLYSLPDTGFSEDDLPPKGVRLEPGDLAALKEALHPGLRVYFY